jgi:SAM-dependent methyltransferase
MGDETRAGYDAVATGYAHRFADELDAKPFDRELLADFAHLVGCQGTVIDLGCGPGQVAAFLATHGVQMIGIDLSPGMVKRARQLHPGLDVRVGDMLDLDFDDESLAGVAAFYSIIHIPRDDVRGVLTELRRMLRPGGLLLLAFHDGNGVEHVDEFLGQHVSLDFVFFTRTEMERYLDDVGFELIWSRQRGPYPDVEAQTERTYLLSRRSV